jgi:tRNA(Ile)-lysidine synthase
MLVKRGEKVVVAHFDHGIRTDSAADARFVELLAARYSVPFVMRREELGLAASEALARTRRYAFLFEEANKLNATVVTAHHADDVIETIAINLVRGTGWRGLAVLANSEVERPLLHKTKAEIYAYALEHRLEWVEDSTNAGDIYLRNRLRKEINKQLSLQAHRALQDLRSQQCAQKELIDLEIARLLPPDGTYKRYFFTMIPTGVAAEMLRFVIISHFGKSLQQPQLMRAVLAIKTFRPGALYEAGDGVVLEFSSRTFIVKPPLPVV